MANNFIIEPDLDFIKNISELGGTDLKKCFQCATCSVACKISPNKNPFPRREMLFASWGIKDNLLKSSNIWLCHNCGDCSILCPRGAKPADVLSAIRTSTIINYAKPKFIAKAVNNPDRLPLLLMAPVFLFLFIGLLLKLVGVHWLNFSPVGENLWQHNFVSNYLVDLIILPTASLSFLFFIISIKHFLDDIHKNALEEKKIDKKNLNYKEFLKSILVTFKTVLKHKKFDECEENQERSTPHMMVFYGFVGLFIVTQCFFIAEWVFHIEGPYTQLNPIKWLGNIAGVSLIVGCLVLLFTRINKKEQVSNFNDWFLLYLILLLGTTGMVTEMLRLAGAHNISAVMYFVHVISVWCLFAYSPFSKLAHILYRFIAMTHQDYVERTSIKK